MKQQIRSTKPWTMLSLSRWQSMKAVHTNQLLYSRTDPCTNFTSVPSLHFSRGSTRSAAQPEDTLYASASTPTYPRPTNQLRMHTMEKTNITKPLYFLTVIFSISVLSMYTIYLLALISPNKNNSLWHTI